MSDKKVLLVHYASPSGQLSEVAAQLVQPFEQAEGVSVQQLVLRPRVPYRFPWPIIGFFNTFPEAIYQDAPELEPLGLDPDAHFDLVVIAYQVWFLAPSLPTAAFLQSDAAKALLKDTPVVTVVACRDMWLIAQERMREYLKGLDARLVGHVALVDEAGSVGSFLATPLWMLTGKRGPLLGGLTPRAGVAPDKIRASQRFSERLVEALQSKRPLDESVLQGTGAVHINTRLLTTENAARRSFLAWGWLLRSLGPPSARVRRCAVVLYIAFLVTLLIVVLPLSALLKTLFAPLLRKRIAAQRAYYSAPSGE